MDLAILLVVVGLIYCVLYFFDTFFKVRLIYEIECVCLTRYLILKLFSELYALSL